MVTDRFEISIHRLKQVSTNTVQNNKQHRMKVQFNNFNLNDKDLFKETTLSQIWTATLQVIQGIS